MPSIAWFVEHAALDARALAERSERIAGNGAGLHFLTEFDAGRERAQAGPLTGVPIVVKDNIDVSGWCTSAGTPSLVSSRSRTTAPVVQQLTGLGARVIGKANLHELAFGITSRNAHFGFVANPLDPGTSAGGSSGGSAAAVALGLVPVALGTDTGGSVRIPAAFCGIVGFRPSHGRYSARGVVPLVASRDTIGLLATSVADVRLIDSLLNRRPAADADNERPLRLGIACDFRRDDLEEEVESQFEQALVRLERAGTEFVDIATPGLFDTIDTLAPLITAVEIRRDVHREVASRGSTPDERDFVASIASEDVRAALEAILFGDAPSAARYREAIGSDIPQLRSLLDREQAEAGLDAIVYPTTPTVAFPIDGGETLQFNGRDWPVFRTTVRNQQTAPLAGLPSISIPLRPRPGRLPAGLTIEGRRGLDDELLGVAQRVEGLLGM